MIIEFFINLIYKFSELALLLVENSLYAITLPTQHFYDFTSTFTQLNPLNQFIDLHYLYTTLKLILTVEFLLLVYKLVHKLPFMKRA